MVMMKTRPNGMFSEVREAEKKTRRGALLYVGTTAAFLVNFICSAFAQGLVQTSAPRYYPGTVNLINCSVGRFPASRPQSLGGAFLLPNGFPNGQVCTIPTSGSKLRRIYDAAGCKYPIQVDQTLENGCDQLTSVSKEEVDRAVPRLWNKYLIIRERILTHTTSSGVIAHEDCLVILNMNTINMFLKYLDPQYDERIKVAVEGVEVSLRANRGAPTLVRSQAIETFGNLNDPEFQRFMREHPEFQAMMVDNLMGSLERNRQRSDNFWAWRNRKLEGSQTAPSYGATSHICRYCDGLATIAGKCPLSPDGRHHPKPLRGPKWDEKWN